MNVKLLEIQHCKTASWNCEVFRRLKNAGQREKKCEFSEESTLLNSKTQSCSFRRIGGFLKKIRFAKSYVLFAYDRELITQRLTRHLLVVAGTFQQVAMLLVQLGKTTQFLDVQLVLTTDLNRKTRSILNNSIVDN